MPITRHSNTGVVRAGLASARASLARAQIKALGDEQKQLTVDNALEERKFQLEQDEFELTGLNDAATRKSQQSRTRFQNLQSDVLAEMMEKGLASIDMLQKFAELSGTKATTGATVQGGNATQRNAASVAKNADTGGKRQVSDERASDANIGNQSRLTEIRQQVADTQQFQAETNLFLGEGGLSNDQQRIDIADRGQILAEELDPRRVTVQEGHLDVAELNAQVNKDNAATQERFAGVAESKLSIEQKKFFAQALAGSGDITDKDFTMDDAMAVVESVREVMEQNDMPTEDSNMKFWAGILLGETLQRQADIRTKREYQADLIRQRQMFNELRGESTMSDGETRILDALDTERDILMKSMQIFSITLAQSDTRDNKSAKIHAKSALRDGNKRLREIASQTVDISKKQAERRRQQGLGTFPGLPGGDPQPPAGMDPDVWKALPIVTNPNELGQVENGKMFRISDGSVFTK